MNTSLELAAALVVSPHISPIAPLGACGTVCELDFQLPQAHRITRLPHPGRFVGFGKVFIPLSSL